MQCRCRSTLAVMPYMFNSFAGMLEAGQASAAVANTDYIGFLQEAAEGSQGLRWFGTPEQLEDVSVPDMALQANDPDEIAYLQFTSGSTRIPRGVIITERALMSNLQRDCPSWIGDTSWGSLCLVATLLP